MANGTSGGKPSVKIDDLDVVELDRNAMRAIVGGMPAGKSANSPTGKS